MSGKEQDADIYPVGEKNGDHAYEFNRGVIQGLTWEFFWLLLVIVTIIDWVVVMQRMTEQRKVILAELRSTESHPTADELYKRVRKRLPRISLGTVYRNLETLADKGTIRKLEVSGTQKRFDGRIDHHYHLRCSRCSRVEDAHIEPIAEIGELKGKLKGYTITDYRLEFVGLCPACRKEADSDIENGPDNE